MKKQRRGYRMKHEGFLLKCLRPVIIFKVSFKVVFIFLMTCNGNAGLVSVSNSCFIRKSRTINFETEQILNLQLLNKICSVSVKTFKFEMFQRGTIYFPIYFFQNNICNND